MSHTIYQTKGIVLERRNFGEADSFFYILTKEFGLIMAHAKGVRNLKSKLRYNLSLFSFGKFCIIRTRSVWRVIDTEGIVICGQNSFSAKELVFLVKIKDFLIRMIKGEEKNDFIWGEAKSFFFQVKENNYKNEELRALEIVVVARILKNLGYLSEDALKEIGSDRLVFNINRAIKESML